MSTPNTTYILLKIIKTYAYIATKIMNELVK